MVYLIIGLALALTLAGYLAWRLYDARQALARAEDRCRSMQKDRAIRQNLQHILDSRGAEIRRLRARLQQYEADAKAMESRASELNLSLFQESGRRILAEKEDGVKRVKMDLMERELEDARQKLREAREAARAREDEQKALIDQQLALIARQQAKIEKLNAAHARRAQRRAQLDGLPNQITMEEILGEDRE